MQVVWSSGFTRSFKKITKRNPQLKEQITEVLILLAEDPSGRSRSERSRIGA
jgi:mRNA interferase YafQ